ncbi:hypothetical protein TeGR_g6772 [Tetraparma gracilis]|uniref:Ribonuclease H1 N-terminal domain-containing protein n=1 Tax=Tetraparma gracilis TaxID=2962635 RepID=A0ABQ6MZC4_9STRA|nr:hypothetical protein TeGR_g6772 [Tetraparma gracilis]
MHFDLAKKTSKCVVCDLPILPGSIRLRYKEGNGGSRSHHPRCLPRHAVPADPSSVRGFSELSESHRSAISSAFSETPPPPTFKEKAPKFYAVRSGHIPGVYSTWPDVLKQVTGSKGALWKLFFSREAAERFVETGEVTGDLEEKEEEVPGRGETGTASGLSVPASAAPRPQPPASALASDVRFEPSPDPSLDSSPTIRHRLLANGGAGETGTVSELSAVPGSAAPLADEPPSTAPAPRLKLSHVPATATPATCAFCSSPIAPPGAVFVRGASSLAYHVDCVSPALCREALADDLVGMGGGELADDARALVHACFRETVRNAGPAAVPATAVPATTTTTTDEMAPETSNQPARHSSLARWRIMAMSTQYSSQQQYSCQLNRCREPIEMGSIVTMCSSHSYGRGYRRYHSRCTPQAVATAMLEAGMKGLGVDALTAAQRASVKADLEWVVAEKTSVGRVGKGGVPPLFSDSDSDDAAPPTRDLEEEEEGIPMEDAPALPPSSSSKRPAAPPSSSPLPAAPPPSSPPTETPAAAPEELVDEIEPSKYAFATRARSGLRVKCTINTCNGMVEHGELRLVSAYSKSMKYFHMHMRCIGTTKGRAVRDGGGVATVSGFAGLSDAHKAEAEAAILDACGKPLYQTATQKELVRQSSSSSSSSSNEDGEESPSPSRPTKRHRAAPASTAAPAVAEGAVDQQLVEQMAPPPKRSAVTPRQPPPPPPPPAPAAPGGALAAVLANQSSMFAFLARNPSVSLPEGAIGTMLQAQQVAMAADRAGGQ